MSFICKKCKKEYQSKTGVYRHEKVCTAPLPKEEKKESNICKFCDKVLSNYTSRWRHEKICKHNEENKESTLRKEIRKEIHKEVHKEISELKTKLKEKVNSPQTINNTTNNNTTNMQNIICVIPFGKEPVDALSSEYIKKTLTEYGINSVIEIVKKKHFNPELPECHNFCVTAKNDIFANVVDPETKKIKCVNKKDVFDKVYIGVVSNINQINEPDEKVKETINKINNIPVSKKILKKLQCGINEEAYHNRDLVKNTWKNAKFDNENKDDVRLHIDLNDVSSDEYETDSDTNSDNELKSVPVKKPEVLNKKINSFNLNKSNVPNTTKLIPDEYNGSDSELSDSDVDDQEDVLIEITIKGKHYVVVKEQIFSKNSDGSPGAIYGRYVNGKIIKKKLVPNEIIV